MAYQGVLESVTNREDWVVPVEVTDPDSGDPIDITAATITLAVRDQKTKTQALEATVGDGITITDGPGGTFQWAFTESQMHGLCATTYDVGLVIEINAVKTQLFVGTVPVLDGIVST